MNLMRALIVDPDQQARREIADLLCGSNFDSVEANDGMGALRFAFEDTIDLIVADIDLRDLDALHLLRIIRGGAFGPTPPPVIVCSADLNDEEWFLHPTLKGVTQLVKPFTPVAFEAALNRAFPLE